MKAVAAIFLTLIGVAALTRPARADEPVAAPLTSPTPAATTPPSLPLALKPSRPLTLAETPASGTGAMAKGLGALVLIGAGAYALRFRKRRTPQSASSEKLRVVRRTSLGVKSELVLIEIDGQEILLGVTAQNIQLLASLGAPTADGIEEADEDVERIQEDRERARTRALVRESAREAAPETRREPRPEARESRTAHAEREPSDQSARLAALLRATGAAESEPPSAPRRTARTAPAREREEALEGQVRSLAKWGQRR